MPATHRLVRLPIVALIALALLVTFGAPRSAHGSATITVTTPDDDDTVNADCSLREAIIAANTNTNVDLCAGEGGGTADAIVFALGAGTPTINIGATPLPSITQWVDIFGGTGGADRIELHGQGGAPSAVSTA